MSIQQPPSSGVSEMTNTDAELNSIQVAVNVVDTLNLIQFLSSVRFKVCLYDNPDFREAAVRLEQKAYQESNYGDRAEGSSLFDNQYRESKDHGKIAYIGVYTRDDILIAFFSFFQNRGTVFSETQEYLSNNPEFQNIPIIVVSKIARDPVYSKLLYQAGMPHRNALALTALTLAAHSPSGILIETKAQPATIRMLQEKNIVRYFPNYRILLSIPMNDSPEAPHIMLLNFPHMDWTNYLYVGRAILGTIFNSVKNGHR